MLAGAFADFVEQVLSAAIDVGALHQAFIGAEAGRIATVAAQGVALAFGGGIGRGLTLLVALLLLLGVGLSLTKVADAIAQGVQRLCLFVERAAQIAVAQRLFGILHRAASLIQLLAALGPVGIARAGQLAALLHVVEAALQVLLAVGERLPLIALTVLQIVEAVIGQFLLVAQGLVQILHRLIAGLALTGARAVALGHFHVVHEVAQLLHQLLCLGGFAVFHQLLEFIQHLVQLILGHLLTLLAVLRGFGIGVFAVLLGLLAHVIVQRVLHFFHQRVDFGGRGTIFDRLINAVLRAFQAFKGGGEVAILDHQGNLPKVLGHGVAGGDVECRRVVVKVADQDAQAQIGLFVADKAFGLVGDGL